MMVLKFTLFVIMSTIVVQETLSSTINFSSDTILRSNLKVNECRQKCYLETLDANQIIVGSFMHYNTCRQNPDCYMCYDYCQALSKAVADLSQSMCSDEVYCSKGCRIACQYHNFLILNDLKYQIAKDGIKV